MSDDGGGFYVLPKAEWWTWVGLALALVFVGAMILN